MKRARSAVVVWACAFLALLVPATRALAEGDASVMSWRIVTPAPNAAPAAKSPARTYKARQRYEAPRHTYPDDWTLGLIMPEISVAVPAAPGSAGGRPGVVIAGDSLAEALFLGLDADPALKAEWSIRHRTVSASGLVREDFHDWPKALRGVLAENRDLTAIVVMIGLNDRQIMRVGEVNLEPLSEPWREAYRKRVDGLIAAAQMGRVPLVWVGMPVMRAPKLSADVAVLNELARDRVAASGETFVDIYDSFADQAGAFTLNGPDIMGDQVRLRGPDGIHFSPAGQRKLAFFVEKALRKLLGDRQGPPQDGPPVAIAPPIDAPGEAPRPLEEVVLPVALPAPLAIPRQRAEIGEIRSLVPANAASALIGRATPKLEDPAARDLFDRGLSPPPRAGRADDFRWR